MVRLTEDEENWLKDNYPKLSYNRERSVIYGPFSIYHCYGDKPSIKATFEIEVRLWLMKSRNEYPIVYNTDNRILKIARRKCLSRDDLHINYDGTLCLGLPEKFSEYFPRGFYLEDLFSILSSFFYWIAYYERYDEAPWIAERHGSDARIEYYIEKGDIEIYKENVQNQIGIWYCKIKTPKLLKIRGIEKSVNKKTIIMNESTRLLYKCIEGRYVKVTWSHKIQESQGDIYLEKSKYIKNIMCWLSVLTTGSALSSMLSFVDVDQQTIYSITACLAVILSYFTIRYKDNQLEMKAKENKDFAAKLHNLRNKYESLMTDICAGLLNDAEIIVQRNNLCDEEDLLYRDNAPYTSSSAVKRANRALKIKKESTTEEDEIDAIVPTDLIVH